MILAAGTVIDRYQFESVLGRGGMAMVYRARHRQLGTPVAIKVLTVDGTAIRDRLVQEGQIQASLVHPNVVRVFDVIQVGLAPGLVMELIEGPSLEEFLAGRILSLEQADAVATALLSGVAAAHARGLVHRDLKPGNVMMDLASGTVVPKVADFGLAKVIEGNARQRAHQTRTGVPMGTPAYMSPEQIRDAKNVDGRTDVFALGAILYHLVSGRRAFDQRDILELFAAIGAGKYEPVRKLRPDIPASMERAIDGALKPDRAERIPDCGTLLRVWRGLDPPDLGRSVSQSVEGPWPPKLVASIRAASAAGAVLRSQRAVSESDEDEGEAVVVPSNAPHASAPASLPPGAAATMTGEVGAGEVGAGEVGAGEVGAGESVGQSSISFAAFQAAAPPISSAPLAGPAAFAPAETRSLRWTILGAAVLLSIAVVSAAALMPVGQPSDDSPTGTLPKNTVESSGSLPATAAVALPASSPSPQPTEVATAAREKPAAAVASLSPKGTASVASGLDDAKTAPQPVDVAATGELVAVEVPAVPVEPVAPTEVKAPDSVPAGPPSGMAFVGLTGDTESVWLVGAKNYRLPSNVPAGEYLIQAYFTAGKATPLKSIRVAAGESRTIKCLSGLTQCN